MNPTTPPPHDPNHRPDEGIHLDSLIVEPARKPGMFPRLRNAFLTGIIVAAPVTITAYLAWSLVSFVDTRVKPLIPDTYNPDTYLPFALPGVGLLIAVVFITTLGALTANFAGRSVVRVGEGILNRMPLVRTIYNALKQIFETVLTQNQASFQKVGLLEFPRREAWTIVFISTDTKGEILEKIGKGEPMYTVFMPTVPNPTSGFLMFVPKKDVVELDMSVEQAAKLAISAGLVVPDFKTGDAPATPQTETPPPMNPLTGQQISTLSHDKAREIVKTHGQTGATDKPVEPAS